MTTVIATTHENCTNLLCIHFDPADGVPNLDCEGVFFNDPALLREYGRQLRARGMWTSSRASKARALELFPDRPRGYMVATSLLSHYASNKATAMERRLRGDIQVALMYEGICERIYAQLPEYAKW